MTQFLCNTADIEDPGSKSFELEITGKSISIFLVKKNNGFFAYHNHCPHTGVNLEWQQDQFLDMDKELIQCATHDALFLIDSGECIAGPCMGKYLQAIPVTINDDQVHVTL